ncbi:MAG TPA: DUF58 domain-containing protein [Gaiellaceae bacterium]|nr:DUF58 domain-containing protein [Gaiellaceae bacterium]
MSRLAGATALGVGVTVAAIAFGSRPLGVAGVGLLLAVGVTRAWSGFARSPVSVQYAWAPQPAVEGERVRLEVRARRASRMPVGSIVVRGRLGRLGEHAVRLRGHGRRAAGQVDLGRLARGRFRLSDATVELGDHLGLHAVSLPVSTEGTVVVHPRLVELTSLFSDAGRFGSDGRRLLLRRAAGFDFHSVRDYEQGESLRRVHWPTTAKRGRLMVKELEDSPRDTVVVVLDCDPGGAAGTPPESSFDQAVRAAGTILDAYVRRGRDATLLTSGADRAVARVRALDPDRRAALDALAAAEPDAQHPLAHTLARGLPAGLRHGELVVVTANLDARAVDALLGSAQHRLVSVAWIDAPSFVRKPTRVSPGLLRLAGAGIPVAVVRAGDELAAALDLPARQEAARA